ncbi:MAG: hypothetical protein RL701_2442 [Pseudomonadota bacterium]
MHLSRNRLAFVIALCCAACEIHTGDSDWDGSFDWDEEDAGTRRPDSSVRDEDGGVVAPPDAAASGSGGNAGEGGSSGSAGAPFPDAGVLPDAGTDPEPTIDTVAAAIARGSCHALEDCLGKALLLDSLDGKDCVEYRTSVYTNRDLHWLSKAVAAGRVKFYPQLLDQCERDLRARRCDIQSTRWPASCREAIAGQNGIDDSCAVDQDCEGAAYCAKGMPEECFGASCSELQAAGLPCSASTQCRDGLSCRSGTCTAPLSEGDECSAHLAYGDCPPGLICQGAAGALTCQSIATVYAAKLGESCDATAKLCALGLVCQGQATGTKGTCAAPAAAGAVCKPSAPGQCPTSQYCKDARANVTTRAAAGKEGLCSDMPSAGQACVDAVGCKPGSVCLESDGKCHALQDVGKTCTAAAECFGGSCQNGTCAAPLDCSL